jgi:soluble lytic murein transglycosylase-like protein
VAAVLILALALVGAVAPPTASAEAAPAAPASTSQSTTVLAATDASSAVATTMAVTPSLSVTLPAKAAPAVPTAPAAPAAPVVKRAVKLSVPAIIAKVGHEAGLSKAEVTALLWIAHRESNFHPTSKSSSGCYGLFQLSKGMASGHPWKDATWNTKRAIKYMKGRYHGVLNAKRFWLSHHWY